MLEFIRRQSTSFMAWLILGAIAVVFGLQFGLPSDTLTLGEGAIAEVHGSDIRNEDYNYQYNLAARFGLIPKDTKMRKLIGANEEVIDGMIERLVLVHEAEKMGLASTKKEAEDVVLLGQVMFFGHRLEWLPGDEEFNYELFTKNWLGSLRVAEPNYLEQQSEELLAQTVRDVVSASVLVPESELRRQYEKTANTLSLRYARYEFAAFTDLVEPTVDQLDAHVAENSEQLEKQYESQKSRFEGLPPQVRVSVLQASTSDDDRTALTEAKAAIEAGTASFADVARERSAHDTAARGGDYGWTNEQSTSASDLPDAVRAAWVGQADGAISEPIEADGGLWLVQVVAHREGDVPKEEALRELAIDAVRSELAKDLAQRAAEEDQNAITAGNPITEVFSQPGALGETTLFGGTSIEDVAVEGDDAAPADGDDSQGDDAAAPAVATADPAAGRSRPKAELRSTGPFPKGQRVPGLGMVPDLVDDAWAQADEAELLATVYEVPGAFVLAGVESKQEATDEGFAEQRPLLYAQLRREKARRVLRGWAGRRCLEAVGSGDIKVSEGTIKRLTTYDIPEDGEESALPETAEYTVCSRVGGRGGLLTARLR